MTVSERAFVDYAPLSGARVTSDGYLVAEVRCARTGCQDYLASELGMPGDGVVTVYRPEEAVFAKDSLATFAGKPVTMGHPPENVSAENWRAYAVGDIGTEIARDGEYVRVPMKLMDAAAIKAVQAGTRQISMGYTTPIVARDGVAPDGRRYQAVQTGPIKINHLAVVPVARGGSQLRIGDGAATWGAAPITTGKDARMTDANTVVLGDKAVTVTALDALTIESWKTAQAKALADAKAAHDAALADKDREIAKRDAEIDALKAKVVDGPALDALVRDRAELIAKAKAIAPTVATDGKSAAQIKREVVIAKRGDAVKDKADAYIDAAFDLLAEEKPDPVRDAMRNGGGAQPVKDFATEFAAGLTAAHPTMKKGA